MEELTTLREQQTWSQQSLQQQLDQLEVELGQWRLSSGGQGGHVGSPLLGSTAAARSSSIRRGSSPLSSMQGPWEGDQQSSVQQQEACQLPHRAQQQQGGAMLQIPKGTMSSPPGTWAVTSKAAMQKAAAAREQGSSPQLAVGAVRQGSSCFGAGSERAMTPAADASVGSTKGSMAGDEGGEGSRRGGEGAMELARELQCGLPFGSPLKGTLEALMLQIQAGVEEKKAMAAHGKVLLELVAGKPMAGGGVAGVGGIVAQKATGATRRQSS